MKKRIGIIFSEIHPLLKVMEEEILKQDVECEFVHWQTLAYSNSPAPNPVCPTLAGFGVVYIDRLGEGTVSYLTQILLLQQAEEVNCHIINRPLSYLNARDKTLSSSVLRREKIEQPITYICSNIDSVLSAILAGSEKMIVKSCQGFSANEVKAFYKTKPPITYIKFLLDRDQMVLIQEFISSDENSIWRIDIVDQTIIVANRRYAYETDDFPIANGSHGGHVEFFDPKKLPSEVANLALKTARVFNLDVCGVDILPTTDGKLLVLEANPEPDITLDRYEFPCAIAQCLIKRLEKGETRKDVICASN